MVKGWKNGFTEGAHVKLRRKKFFGVNIDGIVVIMFEEALS